MAKRQTDAEYWAEDAARQRRIEEIFARMQERYRRADERGAHAGASASAG